MNTASIIRRLGGDNDQTILVSHLSTHPIGGRSHSLVATSYPEIVTRVWKRSVSVLMERAMRIYDAKGSEQDWGWVVEKYNLPEIDRALKDKDHWEVVELRENNRDSSMTVRARWADGSPVEGIGVKFSWPDDFVAQKTDKNGQTGFGMGGGAYYRPPKIGPHTVEILGVSDVVTGLGMLGKRDHWHLEPTFQFVRGEESSDKCQECIRKDKALSEIHAKAAEALG